MGPCSALQQGIPAHPSPTHCAPPDLPCCACCARLCSAAHKDGFAIHVYTASASMEDSCLANADGDMLIVPQRGEGGGLLTVLRAFGLCRGRGLFEGYSTVEGYWQI